jgi:putative transposase
LLDIKGAHQRLYNVALEQRIGAYRLTGRVVGFAAQCRDLTELRAAEPEYAAINAQSEQVTLKRLDLAFAAFFRRVAAGGAAGFPRFKSFDRFSGFGYKAHGDGWKLRPSPAGAHGKLKLSGVGEIKLRGQARTAGTPVTCDIQHKAGRWYASVTLRCEPVRERGTRAVGLDWGVETFATLVELNGEKHEIDNPRFVRSSTGKLARAQKALSRKRRGSRNRGKARRRVADVHRRIANRRADFLHKATAAIVAGSALIATEQLGIERMTAKGGCRKAGLNREILSTAPGAFLRMLQYKAEEAGVEFVEVPTRKVKPTQTCPGCGRQRKKALSERMHSCECGLHVGRDQAAALVCVQWAMTGSPHGREPTVCGAGTAPR